MADFPVDFVADLRDRRHWPDLVDSLWRSPALVELTYGRLWHLVAEVLPAAPARVLDVGCGTGTPSLELARAGHDVTAIDPDPTAIELAGRTVHKGRPGRLAYNQSDVATWAADEATFDVVVTTRTLHHLPEPAEALNQMRHWLRPGGRFVCVDFLHDPFDRRAARWLAQVRCLLEATGAYRLDSRLPAEPDAAVDRIEWEWEQEHVVEQQLNPRLTSKNPCSGCSRPTPQSWHPYLYWDILVGLAADDVEIEQATASLVAAWENSLLAARELPSVLLRFVGSRDDD